MIGRVDATLRKAEAIDGRLLVAAVWLLATRYVFELGFYSDDWSFLATMFLSEDQSPSGLFRALQAAHDNTLRPVQWLALVGLYELFGLQPTGYHVFNAGMLSLGAVLFYFVMRELRQPRILAVAVPLMYALLPHYSTDRFWISTFQANVSMCLYFLSLFADLKTLRSDTTRPWRWKALSLASALASGFAYEVFLPLLLLNSILVLYLGRAGGWLRTDGRHAPMKLLLLSGTTVAAVLSVVIFKALVARRATGGVHIRSYLDWLVGQLLRAFWVSYDSHLLQIPRTVWRIVSDYANWGDIATAGVVAVASFAYLYKLGGAAKESGVAAPQRVVAYYLGLGIIAFVAGHSLFPLDPTVSGVNNRAAIAASVGVALSFAGLGGLVAFLGPSRARRAMFCGVVVVAATSGFLTISAEAKFWVGSYRLQTRILDDIRDHVPSIPRGSTVILDGACPFNGPAVVFNSDWDLSGALQILYGHSDIRANVVASALRVDEDGVAIRKAAEYIVYPYRQLFVFHAGRKERFDLVDAPSARNYFDIVSGDVVSRCPPGEDGLGVEIF